MEEIQDINKTSDINQNKTEMKAPPIFVEGVENISPLKQLLEDIAKNQYTIKNTKK